MSIATLVLMSVAVLITIVVAVFVTLRKNMRRRAIEFGHPSFFDYMRAVPHSDKEKMDAVDLTLQGVVVCFLGLLFPPLLLIGLFPLFYGARKLVYVSMGLGLVDDADQPNQ